MREEKIYDIEVAIGKIEELYEVLNVCNENDVDISIVLELLGENISTLSELFQKEFSNIIKSGT